MSFAESARLAEALSLGLFDTEPEEDFDDIAELASIICGTPMAAISLLDDKRQWFKAKFGLSISETPRPVAFCDHTIRGKQYLCVEDAASDSRFAQNELVVNKPHIRFYAGIPLITAQGHAVGTLFVVDTVPRTLTPLQVRSLEKLARQVLVLFNLRKSVRQVRDAVNDLAQTEETLQGVRAELEVKVRQRSEELSRLNDVLKIEIEQKIAEKNVSESLINTLPGIFYVFDERGKFLRWNENLCSVTAYTTEDILSLHPLDFFRPDERTLIASRIHKAIMDGPTQAEAKLLTKSGDQIPHLFTAATIRIGEEVCVSGMGVDISDRHKFEATLKEAQERYRRLVELSPDAIFVFKNNRCTFLNKAATQLLVADWDTISDADIFCVEATNRIGALGWHVRKGNDGDRFEHSVERDDGWVTDVEVAAADFSDGGQPARLLVVRDITDTKRQKQQLEREANYDSLTHLANRRLLADRIEQALAKAERSQRGWYSLPSLIWTTSRSSTILSAMIWGISSLSKFRDALLNACAVGIQWRGMEVMSLSLSYLSKTERGPSRQG